MAIESIFQIPGFCKKKKNQDIYAYPETPAMAYRLFRTGSLEWQDYPELKAQWDAQMRAVDIVKRRVTTLAGGQPEDLWKHQVLALLWGHEIHSGLLWAWMGTGKTRIMLELINAVPDIKKILILCPIVIIDTWLEQIKKWGQVPHGIAVREPGDGIVLQNYESLWRGSFGKWALKQKWDLIIADECQNIKNANSKQSRHCAKLTSRKKIAMSGTPISNGSLDAFGIYKFLDPGIFGNSYKRFEHKYAVVIDKDKYTTIAGYRNQDDFRNCFNFLCLQIESDVLDLPPISFSTVEVELPAEARQFYDEFEKDFVAYLDGEAMSAMNILTKLLRLQGLTSGVVKLDDGELKVLHESKAEALQTLLEGLDEPVIVFGRFRHDLDEVQRVCRALNRQYHEISGRRKELSAWTDILGVQIQTGRTGIDLTKASIAIFLSTGYSNGDYEQAICRPYRPPQKKPVRIINIHCKRTIDKRLAQILRDKKDLVNSLKTCTRAGFMV
jgi:SNF2 family DNA or RNA helicase